jgi:hypothetical protein
MAISSIVRCRKQDYLRVHKAPNKRLTLPEDTPMLFIFNNKNSIQIAWDSKVPAAKPQTRAQELDVRVGTVGLIRTNNAG